MLHCIGIEVLPRRIRATIDEFNAQPAFRSIIAQSSQRTMRLIRSSQELEREILDTHSTHSVEQTDSVRKGDCQGWSEDKWQKSFKQAMEIHVDENDLTKDFRQAQNTDLTDLMYWWKQYKEHRQTRSIWGEYFRSNLDWNWDPSGSLKCLFRLPTGWSPSRKKDIVPSTVAVGDEAAPGGILDISIGRCSGEPIREVRVKYETETGETRYRTFLHCPSLEDVALDNCHVVHDPGDGGNHEVKEMRCSDGGSKEET